MQPFSLQANATGFAVATFLSWRGLKKKGLTRSGAASKLAMLKIWIPSTVRCAHVSISFDSSTPLFPIIEFYFLSLNSSCLLCRWYSGMYRTSRFQLARLLFAGDQSDKIQEGN